MHIHKHKHVTMACFKLIDLFRFKVEQKIDLTTTLQELGIKSIFTIDADLSAMTGDTQRFIQYMARFFQAIL